VRQIVVAVVGSRRAGDDGAQGPKTKPSPETLVSVLYRLARTATPAIGTCTNCSTICKKRQARSPANAEAWDACSSMSASTHGRKHFLRQSA